MGVSPASDFMNANEPTLEDALTLMETLHEGQVDHSGKPYKHHPRRVAANVRRIFPDAADDTVKAALLHDAIEDCGITADGLRQKGYSAQCVAIIQLVTKPIDDTRAYAQVISDLIDAGNIGAMQVKVADNADNLHPERRAELHARNPAKAELLAQRYWHSLEQLSAALKLDFKEVKRAIENAPSLEASKTTNTFASRSRVAPNTP